MKAIHLALLFLVLLAEGWMLNDFWNNHALAWESTLAFATALVSLVFAEPIVHHFNPPPASIAAPKIAQADVDLFEEFQRELPYDPTILTIQDHDFGGSYRTSYLEPLFSFVATWADVRKEFVDPEIEAEKKKLYAVAKKLAMEIARHTTPEGREGIFTSVFPERLRGGPRPEHVLESARILNDLARQFMPVYEDFVRYTRAKLALPKTA